ncbi:MAG: 3'(2'),5'-bisphosphate nucleotidase CysQ [Alphaproteobacteria bacterium]|nr:3'(2'),5'-bisphosphate nucleotidase CysQ [Alphaproteobacteria bacterium]
MLTDFDLWIPKLTALAELAGNHLCQIYNEKVEVFEKIDGSPVTNADYKSHSLLKEGLEKIAPYIPVVSEEDEASWNIKSPYYWLIDPLDGTKGFIQKTGEFCINIALMKNNHPIFGLIYLPLAGESYYGYNGKAWCQSKEKLCLLRTRTYPHEGLTLLLGGYGKKFKKQEDFLLKSYPINEILRIRSAIKFCYIASGRADLYLRYETCGEWDTAAGHALVEAAGGIVRNLDGTPFLYGKANLENKGFIVFGQKP